MFAQETTPKAVDKIVKQSGRSGGRDGGTTEAEPESEQRGMSREGRPARNHIAGT